MDGGWGWQSAVLSRWMNSSEILIWPRLSVYAYRNSYPCMRLRDWFRNWHDLRLTLTILSSIKCSLKKMQWSLNYCKHGCGCSRNILISSMNSMRIFTLSNCHFFLRKFEEPRLWNLLQWTWPHHTDRRGVRQRPRVCWQREGFKNWKQRQHPYKHRF